MLLKLALNNLFSGLRAGLLACGILLLGHFSSSAGVVTNLTQGDLLRALTNGGPVTFLTSGTLTLTNTININSDAIIDGAGHSVTISGGSSTNSLTNGVRIFFVTNAATLVLRNITIANGTSTNGGGIYNRGTVNISNCVLAANIAPGKAAINGKNNDNNGEDGADAGNGSPGFGGGIYNLGTVSIDASMISGNGAGGSNGGTGGYGGRFGGRGGDGGNGGIGSGGGIYNLGTLSVSNSTFQLNVTGGGEGGLPGLGDNIYLDGDGGVGGAGFGGGIYNLGTLTVHHSTFFRNNVIGGNTAMAAVDSNGGYGGNGLGGGIYNRGTAQLTNNTFTENAARGGKGGDVYQGTFIEGGTGGTARGGAIYNSNNIVIVNCTIATNNAIGGAPGISPVSGNNGNVGAAQGGNLYRQTGPVSLHNTILSKGTNGSNFAGSPASVTDVGFNISSDGTPSFGTGSSSRNGQNILLGALSTNGGFTLTMPLLRNSPAINAGDTNFCLATDQRGVARPQDGRCDIGAYERELAFDIKGLITDGTNKVTNAVVVAYSTNRTNSAFSITNGTYTISSSVPGTYNVTAGAGYQPTNHIVALSGDVTNINFNFVGVTMSPPAFFTNFGGSLVFSISSKPNYKFRIQNSTNLVDWVNSPFFPTNQLTSSNGIFFVSFTNTGALPQLFFRTSTNTNTVVIPPGPPVP